MDYAVVPPLTPELIEEGWREIPDPHYPSLVRIHDYQDNTLLIVCSNGDLGVGCSVLTAPADFEHLLKYEVDGEVLYPQMFGHIVNLDEAMEFAQERLRRVLRRS